jgi:IS1 family transposase
VECDEIWSFNYCKRAKLAKAKAASAQAGDVWTWTAIDADSKLLVSYLLGNRDAGCAYDFMSDVADRLTNRVQLTTDGHGSYLQAVVGAFGIDVDYAQLIKIYGPTVDALARSGNTAPANAAASASSASLASPSRPWFRPAMSKSTIKPCASI